MSSSAMDIFTEAVGDDDTLSRLGPLRAMAGTWEGTGVDVHPVAGGSEEEPYLERYELQPIDRQTNGPQLLYGLRYHTHIVKPGEVETFHDQVGYWLWEPATGTVTHTVAIPRAQVAMATGHATADASQFEVMAHRGSETAGILSNPFLVEAFLTTSFQITVTIDSDGTWSYVQDTVLQLPDRVEAFHHIDRNTLQRVAPPAPNPLAAR